MNTKTDRLQLRVDETSKRLLADAADATHTTISAFVLDAANRRAEQVLAERALIVLDEAAAERFADALAAPPRINHRLMDALARPVKVEWLD